MFNIGPTPFDVRLMAFRIPIRVHPSFWIAMAVFGWIPDHLPLTFLWVLCAFVSVLIHELGHAFTAESFGWPTEIVLYFGGGLAISERYQNNTAWRSIAVSIMGPAAGFLLFGLLVGVEGMINRFGLLINDYRFFIFWHLKSINLYWGLLNLLPVLPLDGGRIFESLCVVFRLRDPVGTALKVGLVVGGAAAYYFFVVSKQQFAGMMLLMLSVQSYTALQSRR